MAVGSVFGASGGALLGPIAAMAKEFTTVGDQADKMSQLWLSKKAPKDIRGGGTAQPVIAAPEGLPFSEMTSEQQKLLKELIAEYLTAMPAPVVRERMKQISDSGMDSIHFGWWGGPELNEPHHYVVQAKTFVIEYNNTQNSANHVHSIWRNLAGDFALPAGK